MRPTRPSSELLARQRYCITTGSSSCCAGGTGPSGPTGPAGATGADGLGVCYGDVFSGGVGNTEFPPLGVSGAYGFQTIGTVLGKSNGTNWIIQSTPSLYYFLDSNPPYTMYNVSGGATAPSTNIECGMIFSPRDGTMYIPSGTGWAPGTSLIGPTGAIGPTGPTGSIGPTGPVHAGAAGESSIIIIVDAPLPLIATFVNPSVNPGSVYASSTLRLSSTAPSEGELYFVVNGETGMSFPYTTTATRPTTHSISQMFTGVTGSPANVSLYGEYTNGISATGTGVLSVMYNMT
jgi:hypothetical protein